MAEKRRLQQIEDLVRKDHYYLTKEDVCFFWGEYTARKGAAHSNTNNLILNLKKKPDRKGKPEWRYKALAIEQTGRIFKATVNPDFLKTATIVPMPPSKARTDPMYDDRMRQVVQHFAGGSDIRELIVMAKSVTASHESNDRRDPDELEKVMLIDENATKPAPKTILVVDDVLTTGAHFIASKRVLQKRFPGVEVVGLFAARRVPQADFDPTDLEAFVAAIKKKNFD